MTFIPTRHFKASEFKHPEKMDRSFLVQLDKIRESAGVPIHITDDYRPNVSTSAHHLGLAVDISDNKAGLAIGSRFRYRIIKAALEWGIKRIGIYDRHIHLDTSPSHDQEVIWYGTSE